MRWVHGAGDFVERGAFDEAELLQQHNYKLLLKTWVDAHHGEEGDDAGSASATDASASGSSASDHHVHWRRYRQAVLKHALPHVWRRRADTRFALAHFARDRFLHGRGNDVRDGKAGSRSAGSAASDPKLSSLDTHMRDLTGLNVGAQADMSGDIPGLNGHHVEGVGFGGLMPHDPSEHVRAPNVLISHLRDGIEVLQLSTGRPLLYVPLPSHRRGPAQEDGTRQSVSAPPNDGGSSGGGGGGGNGSGGSNDDSRSGWATYVAGRGDGGAGVLARSVWADINADGVIDEIRSVVGPRSDNVVDGEEDREHLVSPATAGGRAATCYAVVDSGVPRVERLFTAPLCHPMGSVDHMNPAELLERLDRARASRSATVNAQFGGEEDDRGRDGGLLNAAVGGVFGSSIRAVLDPDDAVVRVATAALLPHRLGHSYGTRGATAVEELLSGGGGGRGSAGNGDSRRRPGRRPESNLVYRRRRGDEGGSSSIIVHDVVFLMSHGQLVRFTPDGNVLWHRRLHDGGGWQHVLAADAQSADAAAASARERPWDGTVDSLLHTTFEPSVVPFALMPFGKPFALLVTTWNRLLVLDARVGCLL